MMKNFFSILFATVFVSLLISCVQNSDEQYEVEDFQTDNESYYKEYEDDDSVSDDEADSTVWDVNFSFSGIINDGNAETVTYGSGLLTYINAALETVALNSTWAIKKSLTLNSDHKIPILQIFFADNSQNADPDGWVLYFILQLEGSSVSSKSETYYLNYDKIYKSKVKLNSETGKIEEICYIQEPDPTKGKINIFTNNIRIGEELKIGGYANMIDMENSDCKKMN